MELRLPTYYLPGLSGPLATTSHALGAGTVDLPQLRAAQLREVMTGISREAQARLRARPIEDILTMLDRCVANWLRPDYPLRQHTEQVLPTITGFSVEMIRHGLPLLLRPLRAEAVRALLVAELGDPAVLDGVWRGRSAHGPQLLTHVLSGNIPGLAASPMLLSLAVKSAVLVKSAASDPLFAALFAASIAEVDEVLGRCLAVACWRGGDLPLEEVAFGGADLVVASGSDAAIAAIAGRVRGRFIGHGHKVSFAVIGRECLGTPAMAREQAARLAYDVSLWDQQGCLSPQLCYVESGGRLGAREFGDLLAEALTAWARELPPRQLDFDEKAQVLRFREAAEWGQHGASALLVSADSSGWSISVEDDPEFLPSCLHRCLRLKRLGGLAELPALLAASRAHLEAAGIAVGAVRARDVAAMLARCGVHRVCPFGVMQIPSLSWRQGGRPRIADWVEWTVVEETGT